jgi:hypothetical protein
VGLEIWGSSGLPPVRRTAPRKDFTNAENRRNLGNNLNWTSRSQGSRAAQHLFAVRNVLYRSILVRPGFY